MQKVTNRLRGFVQVEAESPFPERFVNICAQNRIAFWGVRRLDECRIEATLPAADYERAIRLAAGAGCILTVKKRRGAPFFLMRFRKRYALLVGLVLSIALLFISNQYIWDFSVEGNERLSGEEILSALRDIGVDVGMPVRDVDIISIRNKMMVRLDDLSWISVNVVGSHAYVVVRERREKPVIIPKTQPSNIVAKKSGLIVRMDTLAGSAKVFPGQLVSEGDLLVSGLVDSAQKGVRLVHARADVTARTWYEPESVTLTETSAKRYTGESVSYSYLLVAGKRINLYIGTSQPFDCCDKIRQSKTIELPAGFSIPVTLVTETLREYVPEAYTLDRTETEALLLEAMEKNLSKQITDGEITKKQTEFYEEEGVLRGKLYAEALEKIARSVEIPIAD